MASENESKLLQIWFFLTHANFDFFMVMIKDYQEKYFFYADYLVLIVKKRSLILWKRSLILWTHTKKIKYLSFWVIIKISLTVKNQRKALFDEIHIKNTVKKILFNKHCLPRNRAKQFGLHPSRNEFC